MVGWEYIDSNGEQQGPFQNDDMQAWCEDGYFTVKNLIRQSDQPTEPFMPIAVMRPEFSASIIEALPNISEESNGDLWIILDQDLHIQGPYSVGTLRGWILSGALQESETIMVAPLGESNVRFRYTEDFDEFVQCLKFKEIEFDAIWYYQDDEKQINGPFTAEMMNEFVDTGEFIEETLIYRRDPESISLDNIEFDEPSIEEFFPVGDLETVRERFFDEEVSGAQDGFYVSENGEIMGPFNYRVLCKWVRKEKLPKETLVCLKGEKQFDQIGHHTALKQELPKEKVDVELLNEEISKSQWFYVDDEEITQGPFSAKDMASWIHLGYLKKDRMVCMDCKEGPFEPLESVMRLINEKVASERLAENQKSRPNEEELPKRWMYLDPQLNTQGPFNDKEMKFFGLIGMISKDLFKYKRADITVQQMKTNSSLRILKNWMPLSDSVAAHYPFYKNVIDEWEYLDAEENKHGPYPTSAMRAWYMQGYFDSAVKIKTVKEKEFRTFQQRPPPSFTIVPSFNPTAVAPQFQAVEYQSVATFNKKTGKYEAAGVTGTKWDRQGLPNDSDGRQMARYFDRNAHHEVSNRKKKARVH